MSRRVREPVDVVRRDDAPAQFLWRGRLFAVREVLARWSETGAWWEGAAGEGVAGAGDVADPERDFWRVEAGRGRIGRTGVYDLCLDTDRGQWSLSRVLD